MDLFRPKGSLAAAGDPVMLTATGAGWSYSGLHVARIGPGEKRSFDLAACEGAVVPLSGSAVIETGDGKTFKLAGRADVFAAISDLCYLSRETSFSITSQSGGEFALATAVAKERTDSFYRAASEVEVQIRGAGPATRQINQLLGADTAGPDNLIVVEVLTPEANWSSYPPHKHDELSDDEVPLEEIYYFRIRGKGGFGLHRTYTADCEIDATVTVEDGDVFLIPRGFHGPCVAAPGYDMYYLNVMAGPGDERAWRICTDPDHAWLWDAWEGASPDPRVPMTRA
ncbi:MAG: 5-deoxy-glucuronate isomerase [Actinomycetota bacterium]|nr:5-deoxy-glucuronate isomerase [Actinomycetota bacterium]